MEFVTVNNVCLKALQLVIIRSKNLKKEKKVKKTHNAVTWKVYQFSLYFIVQNFPLSITENLTHFKQMFVYLKKLSVLRILRTKNLNVPTLVPKAFEN